FDIGKRRAHTALRGTRVRTGGVELREHGRAALPRGLDGGAETGAPRPHDDRVVRVLMDVHVRILPPIMLSYRFEVLTCACSSSRSSTSGPPSAGVTACTVPTSTQLSAATVPSHVHKCSPPVHRSRACTRTPSSAVRRSLTTCTSRARGSPAT